MKILTSVCMSFSVFLIACGSVSAQAPASGQASNPVPGAQGQKAKSSATVSAARSLIVTLQGYGEEMEPPSEEIFTKLQSRITPVVLQLQQEGRQVDAQRLALWNQSVSKKLYSQDSEAFRRASKDLKIANTKPGTLAITPSAASAAAGSATDSLDPDLQERNRQIQRARMMQANEDVKKKLKLMFPGRHY